MSFATDMDSINTLKGAQYGKRSSLAGYGIAPNIFILDARAVFPLALWLFHWAYWTFALALACMVINGYGG